MRTFLVLLLAALTGCYSYVPIGELRTERGSSVRARLSTPEDVRLSAVTVNDVVLVDGEVVTQGTDTLVLSALALQSQAGSEYLAAGETVMIPAASVSSLEAKRFSIVRTGLVTIAAAAASVLLFSVFESGGGGDGNGGIPQPR